LETKQNGRYGKDLDYINFIRHNLAEIHDPSPGLVAVKSDPQVDVEGEHRA
jgi:hypothetical protein